METTRHYTATVYVVNDGATVLHNHDGIGKWLPPGGHVDRDELPHEAARREVREEIGTEPTLFASVDEIESDAGRPLPRPQQLILYDVDVDPSGEVAYHQHIDFVYFGTIEERTVTPSSGEAPADDWEWFTAEALRDNEDRLSSDVIELGATAIETIEQER